MNPLVLLEVFLQLDEEGKEKTNLIIMKHRNGLSNGEFFLVLFVSGVSGS